VVVTVVDVLVVVDDDVLVAVVGVALARDVARPFVTVCSVTVCDSTLVDAALDLRLRFLDGSGGGVSCDALRSRAGGAGSTEAAAAAARRVERRVAVDMVLRTRSVRGMRSSCRDLQGSCYAIASGFEMTGCDTQLLEACWDGCWCPVCC